VHAVSLKSHLNNKACTNFAWAGLLFVLPMAQSYDEALQATTEILKGHVDIGRAIRPNDHIQNDLGLDSLGVMEVVADIEDRFNVTIPSETLSNVATVEDVARALVKLTT
jgi:acyl carrier protein